MLCARNVNKKLRRRDEKIKEYKRDIKALRKQNDVFQRNLEIVQQVRKRKYAATARMHQKNKSVIAEKKIIESKMQNLEENFLKHISQVECECRKLKDALQEAGIKRDELSECLRQLESQTIITKSHSQLYKDNVRECCMELMSFNVGMRQVEPVIRSVLKHLTTLDVDQLPKLTTLMRMVSEMKTLSYQQLTEELTSSTKLTLHSDGTTKFGQHYGGFQISTSLGSYYLGLAEMVTGSANVTLQILKMILEDIDLCAGEGVGQKILAGIKNTMSDRHIVEKNSIFY